MPIGRRDIQVAGINVETKILLINPPTKYRKRIQTVPLGLLNIGTALKNIGADVKLIDIDAEEPYGVDFLSKPLIPEKFLKKFLKINPDIVGITSYTENYSIAMKIAQMCKAENENIKIIYGGSHATFQAKDCLNSNSFIDIVVIGEAEHVIGDIINGLIGKLDFNQVTNIAYKKNNSVRLNEVIYPDLNELAPPDLNLIKDKYYPSISLQVEFSRGCPFSCVFCSQSPFSERYVRYFPAKRVVDTLENYQEYFKNFSFFINDPTFLVNHKKVIQFLDEVKERKIELMDWHFETRADTVNYNILNTLKNFGANTINLGIEDIHNSVLRAINKRLTFEDIENAYKLIKKLGYSIRANFIIGLPSQTKDNMFDNIQYSKKLDIFTFPCITPFPGSPIYLWPEQFGLRLLSKDWELYNMRDLLMDSIVFPLEKQKELRQLAWRHCAEHYLDKDFIFHSVRKENERLLELGFDAWYEEWKIKNNSGWN